MLETQHTLGFADCLVVPASLKLQKARNKATEI